MLKYLTKLIFKVIYYYFLRPEESGCRKKRCCQNLSECPESIQTNTARHCIYISMIRTAQNNTLLHKRMKKVSFYSLKYFVICAF
jgi:hypothetical protein